MFDARARIRGGAALTAAVCLALAAPAAFAQTSPYPPADRPWAAADYAALADAVSSGRAPLPTLADPKSRAVFERLVSAHDVGLDMQAKHEGPRDTRLQELLGPMGAEQKLLFAYLTAVQSGKPLERELAKLLSSAVVHAAAASDLAAELLPTLPHDNTYQARMDGLTQMRNGMREILSGVLTSESAPGFYSKASRLEMIGAIKSHLPSFKAVFTDAFRAELVHLLDADAAATSDPEVKAALVDLRTAVTQL